MKDTDLLRSSFTWERQLRPLIDSLSTLTPRAFLVGNAGSGKSTALRHLHDLLILEGRQTSLLRTQTIPFDQVPAEHVLLVDDLHLLDEVQLIQLRERCADPNAALIATGRPWPSPEVMLSVTQVLDQQLSPIVLGHVARADIADALGSPESSLQASCVAHILEATQGVAWLVHEAITLHDVRDCADDPSHFELDQSLQERIAYRLAHVDAATRNLVEEACAAPADGSRPASSADEAGLLRAHSEGLLLRSGLPVPIMRSTVQATMPIHRVLELRIQFVQGSAALLEHRAHSAWQAGDIDAVASLVDEATAAEAAERLVDVRAAVWAARGMMAQADAVYRLSPRTPGETSIDLAPIAAFGIGSVAGLQQASVGAMPTSLGVSIELLLRGLAGTLAAEVPNTALPDLVRAAEMFTASRTHTPVCELPAVIAAVAALNLGALATAQTVIDDALVGEHGGVGARSRLLLWRAWVATQLGHPESAREALRQASQLRPAPPARDLMLAHAVRVALARRYEDAAGLESAWRHARTSILRADIDAYLLHPLIELVSSATRVGDSERMQPHLDRALEIVSALGDPPLWTAHLYWAGIQQGILLNSPDRLAPYAKALVAVSAHSPVATMMARAGRVWTAVLGGSVDATAVETAAEGLAAVGLRWDAARLAGHGAARTTDRKTATRLLACARALHPPEGPRRQLAMPDESAHPAPQPIEDVLSERELEVARLVLQGRTYAEIGEAIFISPRTAEHHIAHIRRRIGATSRSEMLEKLRVLLNSEASDISAPSA